MAAWIMNWMMRWRQSSSQSARWWVDGKAAVVLLATAIFAAAHLADEGELPPIWFSKATFGLILFYFGAR